MKLSSWYKRNGKSTTSVDCKLGYWATCTAFLQIGLIDTDGRRACLSMSPDEAAKLKQQLEVMLQQLQLQREGKVGGTPFAHAVTQTDK